MLQILPLITAFQYGHRLVLPYVIARSNALRIAGLAGEAAVRRRLLVRWGDHRRRTRAQRA
jgi:hypothetical protein